jgi:hypothetical protein
LIQVPLQPLSRRIGIVMAGAFSLDPGLRLLQAARDKRVHNRLVLRFTHSIHQRPNPIAAESLHQRILERHMVNNAASARRRFRESDELRIFDARG